MRSIAGGDWLLRHDDDAGYLLRALRNTHRNRYRSAARRPLTRQLSEGDAPRSYESAFSAREIMHAIIASVPVAHGDALIAVDVRRTS